MITYEWSDWRNGNFWWIQSVYVKPKFRAHGVFTSLYKFIEQLARQRKDVCGLRLYVDEANERAKKTYEKMGMHATQYQLYEVDFVMR
jgi:GNAT superfamily N-acetyltransferase